MVVVYVLFFPVVCSDQGKNLSLFFFDRNAAKGGVVGAVPRILRKLLGFCRKVLQNVSHIKKVVEEDLCRLCKFFSQLKKRREM